MFVAIRTMIPLILIVFIFNGCGNDTNSTRVSVLENPIPVSVEEIKSRPFNIVFKTIGKVASSQMVPLYFSIPGTVDSIFVESGDKVKKNMALAGLEADQYEAQYQLARSAFEKAEKDLASTEELFNSNVVSQDRLDNVRVGYNNARASYVQARKAFSNTVLRAPFDGSVISRDLEIGAVVAPGAVPNAPFVIANMEDLKVIVSIPESDIGNIKPGQKVNMTFKTFPKRAFKGMVRKIGLATRSLSNSFDVEIEVMNTTGELRLGLVADVQIILEELAAAIVLPVDMVHESNSEAYIFTVDNNRAQKTPVRVIHVSGSDIVLENSMKSGTRLISRGYNDVMEGSLVEITADMIGAE